MTSGRGMSQEMEGVNCWSHKYSVIGSKSQSSVETSFCPLNTERHIRKETRQDFDIKLSYGSAQSTIRRSDWQLSRREQTRHLQTTHETLLVTSTPSCHRHLIAHVRQASRPQGTSCRSASSIKKPEPKLWPQRAALTDKLWAAKHDLQRLHSLSRQ